LSGSAIPGWSRWQPPRHCRFTDDPDKRHSVITRVRVLTADPVGRRGLVYVASRKDAEFYTDELA
jgi:ATP-dependent DNA helicase RecQ